MEEKKVIFAANLIRLRTDAHMTQAELAERINYSDKSISKWERAEALPSDAVIESIAEALGTTSAELLRPEEGWSGSTAPSRVSTGSVTAVVMLGIWTVALLLFIIFWMLDQVQWIFFLAAIPISLIAMLVLNILWFNPKANMYIVAALVLSIFILIYYIFRAANPWKIFLLLIPAEAIVYFSYRIRRKKK